MLQNQRIHSFANIRFIFLINIVLINNDLKEKILIINVFINLCLIVICRWIYYFGQLM